MPLFSVVIPTHERSDLLEVAVTSVHAQSVTDWECIVVVDGGTVPAAITDAGVFRDPRVEVVVRDSNGGPAAARNTGLEVASGKYVAFLDDDDKWVPDRLEIALEGLARADVCVCFGSTDGAVGWRGEWVGDVSDTILDAKAPSVNGLAVVREMCPRFDERFRGAEDVEWVLRLAHTASFATVARVGFARGNAETDRPDFANRVDGIRLLLAEHREYFAHHRRAAARWWAYFGECALAVGRRQDARTAGLRALLARPNGRSRRLVRHGWSPRPTARASRPEPRSAVPS